MQPLHEIASGLSDNTDNEVEEIYHISTLNLHEQQQSNKNEAALEFVLKMQFKLVL